MSLFESSVDIGAVNIPGTASLNLHNGEFTITASGADMWNATDECHFAFRKITGDFIVTAQGSFEGGNSADIYRKFGWTARSNLDTSSPQVTSVIHGDGHFCLHARRTEGANYDEINFENTHPDTIQLARRGSTFTLSAAKFGSPMVSNSFADINLPETLFVGLFVCSHQPNATETVLFKNVRITIPAKPDFIPYTDYIGSRLEVLDVDTGIRTVVHTTTAGIEAPNWTRDDKFLIFNSRGKIYQLDLVSKEVTEINTDFATSNNNDHVLSFDGSQLAISHHAADDNKNSNIYTLPRTGGIPTRITKVGPSYLHGWSPDAKFLTYTAERSIHKGIFNIYKIQSQGGEEIQLTHSTGSLEDGPEFSPCGKYIYFNSTRTGRMQLFRMSAEDGANPEQLTFDEDGQNWFPHVSPDNSRIVYLSYGNDVEAREHPYYKDVVLKVMDLKTKETKIIAYLYGGQGTINVPSWSQDGKRVAFVSHTQF
ncbi:hypothetical protein HK098_002660 [Nowakowskiella sp. JEL0407]|nr:hypothetical protein HK098_002660 [Nowakowskiella sp. JEL0407]